MCIRDRREGRTLIRQISSECVHCVGFRWPKTTILGKFWHFWGLLYIPTPFYQWGQIWAARADPRSTSTGQISSECVHCVGCRWPKTTILGKFWHFWGLLYRPPFIDEGQIWCAIADPRSTLTCQISSRSGFFCRPLVAKNPQFLRFFGLRHLVLSPIGNSLIKLNTGAQLQTFPYPTASKSFL